MNITNKLKNYFLNKSGRYLFYKSEYTRLKELSVNQEDIKLIDSPKENPVVINDSQQKKLKDIRTCHLRDCLDNVMIGEYTYGHPHIECYALNDKLTIGKFCSIAKEVTILIGMQHPIHCGSTFPFGPFMGVKPYNPDETQYEPIPQETIIGNDVWIGYGVTILSGVTIGDGAVIGAKAVVSKDVEPYSIVVGSPLKCLRFPKHVIKALLKKKWWDLPDEQIEKLAPYLLQPDMDLLIEKLNSI